MLQTTLWTCQLREMPNQKSLLHPATASETSLTSKRPLQLVHVQTAGLTDKSRCRVTKKDVVEVWRSHFEALLGGQTEQDEADT